MHKLTYSNQWESDVYKVGGQRIRTLKTVNIHNQFYKVTTRNVGVSYSDMGQPGMGYSDHYFIKKEVFGIEMEFDLNKIVKKVPVYAVDYYLENE